MKNFKPGDIVHIDNKLFLIVTNPKNDFRNEIFAGIVITDKRTILHPLEKGHESDHWKVESFSMFIENSKEKLKINYKLFYLVSFLTAIFCILLNVEGFMSMSISYLIWFIFSMCSYAVNFIVKYETKKV